MHRRHSDETSAFQAPEGNFYPHITEVVNCYELKSDLQLINRNLPNPPCRTRFGKSAERETSRVWVVQP